MKKLALVFLVSAFAFAAAKRTINLRAGEKVTVGDAVVTCVSGSDSSASDRCDDFSSESSCRGLAIGSFCSNDSQRGRCAMNNNFGGKLRCSCVATGSKDSTPICDDFHSDGACQKLQVGSPCSKDGKPAMCVQESTFGGKPNCKCQ